MNLKSKMSMGYYIMLMLMLCIILRLFLEGFYDGFHDGMIGVEAGGQLSRGLFGGWRNVLRDILFDAGTAGLFAFLLYKKISMPFKNLTKNMNQIVAGDLAARISMDSPKEAYEIGNAFNAMAENLQSTGRQDENGRR